MTDTAPAPSTASVEPPLSGIAPISVKKTLMIVNNFIINTADFLNKFTALCESKLSSTSRKLQTLEIVLQLLEAKLDSIQWMGSGGVDSTSSVTSSGVCAVSCVDASGSAPSPEQSTPSTSNSNSITAPAAAPAPVADTPVLRVKDDSRYSKYFKMLNMGVPKPAIKQKMNAEGVDGNVIDLDPDAPAPPGGEAAQSQAIVTTNNQDSEASESDMSDQD